MLRSYARWPLSVGLLAAVSCLMAPPARAEFPRGKPAPSFTLKQIDGPKLSLASLRGKVVLLDFWSPT